MTSAVAALGIAVAAISAVCYALLNRAEKIKRNRRPTSDNPTDGAGASGGDGRATAIWFGGHHSAIDSSGNPSDFSGGDTSGGDSGGGDGGGGDGGGGGD